MSDATPAQAFTDKWRAHWPQWPLAEVFIPAQQRDLAVAWFALLHEWFDAALSGDEPAPGLAKLAWWQEELRGWSKGARRHPLGEILQKQPLDWTAIADALPVLRQRDTLQSAQAIDTVQPLAQHLAQAEAQLFGEAADPRALAVDCLRSAGVNIAASDAPSRASLPRRMLHASVEAQQRELSRWRLPWHFWRHARAR